MSTPAEKMLVYLRNQSGMRAMVADANGRAVLGQWRETLATQQAEHRQCLAVCEEAIDLIDKALGRLQA